MKLRMMFWAGEFPPNHLDQWAVVEIAKIELFDPRAISSVVEKDRYVDRFPVPAGIFIHPLCAIIIAVFEGIWGEFSVDSAPWNICDVAGFKFGLTDSGDQVLKALLGLLCTMIPIPVV